MIKKPKIKAIIEKVPNANQIYFQILEMDERFRQGGGDKLYKNFQSKNGIIINSINFIDVSKVGDRISTLCLRGIDTKRDNDAFIINIKYPEFEISKIKDALSDWSENWKGFKEKPKKCCLEKTAFTC